MIKVVVNPKYQELEGFIESLPMAFLQSGEVIYSGRNLLKTFDVKDFKLNAKSFKKPILINQFMYATFRPSKAKRSYYYAFMLKERGFHTPDPVAYMEQEKFNLLQHSLYVSIHENFDGLMQEFRYGQLDGRENLLTQFAQYTARLHEKKVLHIDYSPGNILYKKNGDEYTFYLVDLNRMTFDKPISLDDACFNFRRLWGNDDMIKLIVEEYAHARNFDVDKCLKKTFEYRKKFWDNYMKQYPDWSPYVG